MAQTGEILVTTFFRFVDLAELEELRERLVSMEGLKGLILLASEGINGTVSGKPEQVKELRSFLDSKPEFSAMEYKDSWSFEPPFPRWKVQIREQLIRYIEGYSPRGDHHHLTPREWHALLKSGEPVTLLDTRNRYETELGTFRNAIDPEIDTFTEFAAYLDQCDLPKQRTTLIFCTGGVRCEKAILDMEERGFEQVYQLRGGILKYLEEFPEQEFEGECFVFDQRVAVDQYLDPSRTYWICPHCGDPGQLETVCRQCEKTAKICHRCVAEKPTCCKDCQYHLERTTTPRSTR